MTLLSHYGIDTICWNLRFYCIYQKKKKITTTPQLKEQLSKRNLSFFFPPDNVASQFIWAWQSKNSGNWKGLNFRALFCCIWVLDQMQNLYLLQNETKLLFCCRFLGWRLQFSKVTGSNISCPYCQVINLIYIWSPVFIRKL